MSTPPNPLVRISAVCRELGIHRSTFDSLRARGEGPKVFRISERCLGVRRNDLEAWLAEREDVPAPKK